MNSLAHQHAQLTAMVTEDLARTLLLPLLAACVPIS
jgi:hypothetical protein